nr:EOG090X069C [Sida crystallina]
MWRVKRGKKRLGSKIRKTLYYGILPKQERPSWALTNVVMEKFSERDENSLFLEKLRFEYASNLSREACVSPCSLVLALIYLERLMKSNPNYVSSIPSSKLFLVSVMVASKFLNDEGEEDEVFNHEWANCAQIDVAQLNQLEREFLTAIDWSLFVDEEDFATALAEIEYKVARSESLKRGWMTYTDLDILGRTQLLLDTWDLMVSQVINVSLACTAAYLASLVTLVGSALVVSSLPWNAPHQLPTDLTIDTGSISTTGNRLSHLSVDGSGSSHCTESSLDLETEPDVEALLSNLTQFANIVQDDDDNDQSKLDTFTFPQWLSYLNMGSSYIGFRREASSTEFYCF